jgi:peptide/nickel transport system substrate-binding protein
MQFARKDAPEFVRLSGAGYTRRDMLKAGGIAIAAVTVPTLSPFVTRAGAQETPQGGTLIVGLVAEPTSLDPGQLTDINSMRLVRNIYDGLTGFEPGTFTIKPLLAESWDISDDGLTYTFHLRDGVVFHDGTPFNADAVKFAFDRMLDEEHPYHDTGPFPFASFYFGAIDEIEVVDDQTAIMHLKQPYAPLLNTLAVACGFIPSPEAVKTLGKDYSQSPVGTGPFKFVSWEHNQRVTLEGNSEYFEGAPLLQNLVFRPIVEEQTRLTELLSGGVNFIVDVPPDNIAQIKEDPNFTFMEQPGPHIWWVTINTQMPPFDDVRVRQALNYAVNKEAIVSQILQNTGDVAHTVVPPAIEWAHNPDAASYPYDPEKAKQLLAEAGYPDGFETTFWVTESGSGMQSPKTMAEAIQADLQAVGITVNIEVAEWGAYLNLYNAGMGDKAGLAEMSWMFDTGDPHTVLPLNFSSDGYPPNGFNTGLYINERVDELMKQAAESLDQEERGELYKEVQEITSEEAPWIFIDNAKQNAAMVANVKGFVLSPSFLLSFKDTYIEE